MMLYLDIRLLCGLATGEITIIGMKNLGWTHESRTECAKIYAGTIAAWPLIIASAAVRFVRSRRGR